MGVDFIIEQILIPLVVERSTLYLKKSFPKIASLQIVIKIKIKYLHFKIGRGVVGRLY